MAKAVQAPPKLVRGTTGSQCEFWRKQTCLEPKFLCNLDSWRPQKNFAFMNRNGKLLETSIFTDRTRSPVEGTRGPGFVHVIRQSEGEKRGMEYEGSISVSGSNKVTSVFLRKQTSALGRYKELGMNESHWCQKIQSPFFNTSKLNSKLRKYQHKGPGHPRFHTSAAMYK